MNHRIAQHSLITDANSLCVPSVHKADGVDLVSPFPLLLCGAHAGGDPAARLLLHQFLHPARVH